MARPVPIFEGNLSDWARRMSEYLRAERGSQRFADPQAVQLLHTKPALRQSASQDGVLLYDPAQGVPIFSRGGAWLPISGGGGGVTDHGALSGLADDDHPQYLTQARGDARYEPIGGGGVTDHGALTGLADDDHTQYHNDTRGDARYLKLTGGDLSGPLAIEHNEAVPGLTIKEQTGVSVTDHYPVQVLRPSDTPIFRTLVNTLINSGEGHVVLEHFTSTGNAAGGIELSQFDVTLYGSARANIPQSDHSVMSRGRSDARYLQLTGGSVSGNVDMTGASIFNITSTNYVPLRFTREGTTWMFGQFNAGADLLIQKDFTTVANLPPRGDALLDYSLLRVEDANALYLTPTTADGAYLRLDGTGVMTGSLTLRDMGDINGTLFVGGSGARKAQFFQSGSANSNYIGFVPRNADDTGYSFGSRLAWDVAQQKWCIGTSPIATTTVVSELINKLEAKGIIDAAEAATLRGTI